MSVGDVRYVEIRVRRTGGINVGVWKLTHPEAAEWELQYMEPFAATFLGPDDIHTTIASRSSTPTILTSCTSPAYMLVIDACANNVEK